MDYLPLFHNLKGRRIVVVGGGEIALRKVRLVQQASALITIIAKDFCHINSSFFKKSYSFVGEIFSNYRN